jgi:uncharacterized protein YndB with AHSA1/START domain
MAAAGRDESGRRSLTTLERVSGRELAITRTFRAPAEIVFDAWTRPEFVKQWWAPESRGVTLVECDADLRVGGKYRYVLEHASEGLLAFSGEYLEFERPSRLVYTQRFEPVPGDPAVVTVTFEERDGSTTLVAREVYPSKEILEGVLESGMEEGMRETLDQLAALLASQRD